MSQVFHGPRMERVRKPRRTRTKLFPLRRAGTDRLLPVANRVGKLCSLVAVSFEGSRTITAHAGSQDEGEPGRDGPPRTTAVAPAEYPAGRPKETRISRDMLPLALALLIILILGGRQSPRGGRRTAAVTGPGLGGDTASGVGRQIGYARVSTRGQDLALQLEALEQAGCARIFQDVGSGTIRRRPQLDACLNHLRAGDTLVVWRLDRLGR